MTHGVNNFIVTHLVELCCCTELVLCVTNNKAIQKVNRAKGKTKEQDSDLYSVPDIFREIISLKSNKHVAQVPKKVSYKIEHQTKRQLEMSVNGVK
jgi:hypothetical protein